MTLLPPPSNGSQVRETLLKWESQDTACLAHPLPSPALPRLVSSMPPASHTHNATSHHGATFAPPNQNFFYQTPPSPRKGLLGSPNGASLLQLSFSFQFLQCHLTCIRQLLLERGDNSLCLFCLMSPSQCLALMPDDFLAEVKRHSGGREQTNGHSLAQVVIKCKNTQRCTIAKTEPAS